MSVGENIKKRRVAKGLSQAELAGAIGVGQSYLSQIERGTKTASIQLENRLRKFWNARWMSWLKDNSDTHCHIRSGCKNGRRRLGRNFQITD